jgi:hypothetical protein
MTHRYLALTLFTVFPHVMGAQVKAECSKLGETIDLALRRAAMSAESGLTDSNPQQEMLRTQEVTNELLVILANLTVSEQLGCRRTRPIDLDDYRESARLCAQARTTANEVRIASACDVKVWSRPGGNPSASVASVTVSLDANTIAVGQTTRGTVIVRDPGGNLITGRTTTWSSARQEVASVSDSGLVSGLSLGTGSILAEVEGVTGLILVTVTDPRFDTREVGVTIAPGLYRSLNVSTPQCVWQLETMGIAGMPGEITKSEFNFGPSVVEISTLHRSLSSLGCEAWNLVINGPPMRTNPAAPFGEGTFVFNDIMPGIWQAKPSGARCHWARLRSFFGKQSDKVTEGFGNAPTVVVTIEPTDRGFASGGCGLWSKIG